MAFESDVERLALKTGTTPADVVDGALEHGKRQSAKTFRELQDAAEHNRMFFFLTSPRMFGKRRGSHTITDKKLEQMWWVHMVVGVLMLAGLIACAVCTAVKSDGDYVFNIRTKFVTDFITRIGGSNVTPLPSNTALNVVGSDARIGWWFLFVLAVETLKHFGCLTVWWFPYYALSYYHRDNAWKWIFHFFIYAPLVAGIGFTVGITNVLVIALLMGVVGLAAFGHFSFDWANINIWTKTASFTGHMKLTSSDPQQRQYPVTRILDPLPDDLSRSILTFAPMHGATFAYALIFAILFSYLGSAEHNDGGAIEWYGWVSVFCYMGLVFFQGAFHYAKWSQTIAGYESWIPLMKELHVHDTWYHLGNAFIVLFITFIILGGGHNAGLLYS